VLHQVGVGALGPVFRTYEPTRDRLVAVKVFRLDITPEGAEALADELAVATGAGLFHPSVVEPIASGVEGTVAYRAEEYVAAESLDVAMRHYAPASMDKVLPFISQLAAAVDFARMAGVGHGALHPRDIFVTTEEARATGFGVVEALERVGLRAPVRRPYSAPERVAGQAWSTPADVFSLSAIAYELLTGRRPAGVGADIGDLSGASLGSHSAAVRSVLVRGMEEDPAARFPTAMAFASALESASRGESTMPAPAAAAPAPVSRAAPVPVVVPPVQAPAPAAAPTPPAGDDDDDEEDVVAERHEDNAYAAFAREENDEERPLDLFEVEAVEDLPIDLPPVRFADEFGAAAAQEPAPRYDAPMEPPDPVEMHSDAADDDGGFVPPRRSIDYVPADEPFGVMEPPRRRTLPLALMLLLGLAVGFAAGWGAGYGAASRSAAPDTTPAAGAGKPADAAPPQTAEGGKAYSEQAVTPSKPAPSTQPPPVPGDAPAASPPPAPSAAAAPPAQGRIIVRSVPAGAAVTIDGKWRGRTPLTLDKLALGNHDVRVVQTGFDVATESVSLSARAPSRTLSLKLRRAARAAPPATPPAPAPRTTKPAPAAVPPAAPPARAKGPGSLYVDSRPRGAAVFLDGKQIGVTPVALQDVAAGAHVVRLELVDHRVWTANSQVLAGQQTRVTGSLERIR
jgi:serine/threonine-protein kinase